jgi:transposase
MTHPGVGPLTALAFELVIGTPERFHCGKQIASYVGLAPSEESSGDRRRLGQINKLELPAALSAGGSGPGDRA